MPDADRPTADLPTADLPTADLPTAWKPVLPTADLSVDRVVALELDDAEAVAWRTGDRTPCVMARRCPHLDWDLTEAIIIGDELLCAGHGWSLRADGRALKRNEYGREDAKGTIRTWPARDHDGWIEVDPGSAPAPST